MELVSLHDAHWSMHASQSMRRLPTKGETAFQQRGACDGIQRAPMYASIAGFMLALAQPVAQRCEFLRSMYSREVTHRAQPPSAMGKGKIRNLTPPPWGHPGRDFGVGPIHSGATTFQRRGLSNLVRHPRYEFRSYVQGDFAVGEISLDAVISLRRSPWRSDCPSVIGVRTGRPQALSEDSHGGFCRDLRVVGTSSVCVVDGRCRCERR
jgi:hypothetical protein